jgi:hypothetical protein
MSSKDESTSKDEKPPRANMVDAIHSPAFAAAMPIFIAHAARRLRRVGWGETEDRASARGQVEDVIDETTQRCLDGRVAWDDTIPFVQLFCRAMRDSVSIERKREKRRGAQPLSDIPEPPAPSSRRDELIAYRQTIQMIRLAIAGDAEVADYFEACLRVEKRADVAKALGWSVDRAKLVKTKLNRRLAAANIHWSSDDD